MPKSKATELVVTNGVYPSGTSYLIIQGGSHIVGHVHRVDGGWIRHGWKKPRSLEQAVRDIVSERILAVRAELQRFEDMLDLPLNVAAVDPDAGASTDGLRASESSPTPSLGDF